jgi:magnesium-transporting ATPase (P-type)
MKSSTNATSARFVAAPEVAKCVKHFVCEGKYTVTEMLEVVYNFFFHSVAPVFTLAVFYLHVIIREMGVSQGPVF